MYSTIADNQTITRTLAPALRTVTANGATVTSSGDYARAAVFDIGLWVDGSHVFKLQSSTAAAPTVWANLTVADVHDPAGALDTGLASTDVAIITVDGATDDDVIHVLDILSTAENVRAVCTIGGGPGTGLQAGVTIVEGHPKRFAGTSNPMLPGGLNS
jgi:hypothetical protein